MKHQMMKEFRIEELKDRFVLGPVNYNNTNYESELRKELLDNGEYHSALEWQRLLKYSEWSLPSASFYFAMFKTLYQNRDGKYNGIIDKLTRKFFEDFWENGLITSTRIDSVPDAFEITNDYEQGGQYLVTANEDNLLESLFGANSDEEAEQIIEWASRMEPVFEFMDVRDSYYRNLYASGRTRVLTFGRELDNGLGIETINPSSRLKAHESEYLKQHFGASGISLEEYFAFLVRKYDNNLLRFNDDYPQGGDLYDCDLSAYLNLIKEHIVGIDYISYARKAHGIIKRKIIDGD